MDYFITLLLENVAISRNTFKNKLSMTCLVQKTAKS